MKKDRLNDIKFQQLSQQQDRHISNNTNPIKTVLKTPDLVRRIEEWNGRYLGVAYGYLNDERARLVRIHVTPRTLKGVFSLSSSSGERTQREDEEEDIVTIEDPFEFDTVKYTTHRKLVAAQDNGVIAVASTETKTTMDEEEDGERDIHILRYYSVGKSSNGDEKDLSQPPVKLPGPPRSLHVVGRTAVYVGLASGVIGWVDYSQNVPAYQHISGGRAVDGEKGYNMFVRNKDLLVAVDDWVQPHHADVITLLSERGEPVHRGHWTLPLLMNGQYKKGRLVVGENNNNDNELLFVRTFLNMQDGRGQDLIRLPFALPTYEFESSPSSRLIEVGINQDWEDVVVRQESDEILVAAQYRGLLSFPLHFESGRMVQGQGESKAKQIIKFAGQKVRAVRLLDGDGSTCSSTPWVIVGYDNHPSTLVKVGQDNLAKRFVPLGGSFNSFLD